LQEEAVQLSTFGRLLEGQPDELVDFEESLFWVEDPQFVTASGKACHAIVTFNGNSDSRVPGMALEMTEDELAKADQYEPAGYERIPVTLPPRAGGHGFMLPPACQSDPMSLLTPTERFTLKRIRDKGTAFQDLLALALRKGWVAKAGAGRGKGAAGKEARYSLTEAGEAALAEDEDARREARATNRPRRR
jgi:hypothetical protein